MSRSPDKMRAWASINLSALERNLKAIRMALPSHLRFISVVKANAYGHGLAPVVTRLMRSQADAFAVANLEEAARLREVGTGWPVLVLSVLLPEEYEEAIGLGIHPVVSTMEEVRSIARLAKQKGTEVGLHLKVDTGMGRLGVWYPDFPQLLDEVNSHDTVTLAGICTHYSSADSDPEFTNLQRDRFLECLKLVPGETCRQILVHADNSAGIESFPEGGGFNAARIGLLQFGVRPKPGSLLGQTLTEPVLSFHARVGLVKDLPAGSPVSYGQTHKLVRSSRVAVLTAGYADGLPTDLSNTGKVIIQDKLCPIIGRVTMDQTMVDVTDLPTRPAIGDTATFIGQSGGLTITATDFASWAGRIEWEVFCSLSDRTQRIYRTDTAV
ncbi:MAG: alanine racemase [Puniceicoccaceae bacterium]